MHISKRPLVWIPLHRMESSAKTATVVHNGSPIMDCLHKLGLTGEPCLKSMLVMEDNLISIEVFPYVAKNDMLHHIA